jgi:hypothetical protein
MNTKQITPKLLATLILLSSIALPPALALGINTPVAIARSRKATTKRYSVDGISFNAPSHWIDYSNSSNSIVLYNQTMPKLGGGLAPVNMIRLNAGMADLSFDDMANPSRPSMTDLISSENLSINGRKAVRQYRDGGGHFDNVVITYIAVGEGKTFTMAIMYSARNKNALKFINQIHNSTYAE